MALRWEDRGEVGLNHFSNRLRYATMRFIMRKLDNNDPRYQQLRAEVDDPQNNLARQDIIDIALDEYFQHRYSGSARSEAKH